MLDKPRKLKDCGVDSFRGYVCKLMLDEKGVDEEPIYLFFEIPREKSFKEHNDCSIHIPQLYNLSFLYDDFNFEYLTILDIFLTEVMEDGFNYYNFAMDIYNSFMIFTEDGVCTVVLKDGDDEVSFNVTFEALKEFQKEYHKTILEIASKKPEVKKMLQFYEVIPND